MAGLSRDFAGRWVRGQWPAYHISKLTYACCSFVRMDYRTIGPADASGQWEAWINAPVDERTPFLIDTDDRRITGASPTTDGRYMAYVGNSPFRPKGDSTTIRTTCTPVGWRFTSRTPSIRI